MKDKTWNHKTWNYKIWLLAVVLALSGGAAAAETYTIGSIEVGNPWARATPKGASVAGAYMTITNKGAEADRLMGVSSPIANQSQVHQMAMDNGVMSMRPV
jgi:copper(I)-binding protein